MNEGLSVIVCTFNGRERVAQFLVPLRGVVSRLDFPAELIVVDDGSSDGTVEALRTLGGEVHVIPHDSNKGPAVARNTGILAARYEWLLFCDDDLEIEVATITGLWRFRERRTCLVPELRGVDGRLQNAATSAWRRGDLKIESQEEPVPVLAYPVSACLLVNAHEVRASGGFDERFQIYYED